MTFIQSEQYTLSFKVRDYECDIVGVLNNAVYQCYLEHARHEFLKTIGIDFARLAKRNISLATLKIDLDYRYPLRSGDEFIVTLAMERISRFKFKFNQDIYRQSDNKLILNGIVIGTALNAKGRPEIPKELEELLPT